MAAPSVPRNYQKLMRVIASTTPVGPGSPGITVTWCPMASIGFGKWLVGFWGFTSSVLVLSEFTSEYTLQRGKVAGTLTISGRRESFISRPYCKPPPRISPLRQG